MFCALTSVCRYTHQRPNNPTNPIAARMRLWVSGTSHPRMERDPLLEALLAGALEGLAPVLSHSESAYELEASHGAKRAKVIWPVPLPQLFFEFYEGEALLFSDSAEYYAGETLKEMAEEAIRVVGNFLSHETRLLKVGRLLKRPELQYEKDREWRSIFS